MPADREPGAPQPGGKPESQPDENGNAVLTAIPFWEWLVVGSGAAVVGASLGLLVYQGLTAPNSPPDITVRAISVQQSRAGFLVRIRVANDGGTTAARVMVEGALREAGRMVETAETTIDYVPPRSKRRGGLFFTRDPRSLEMTIRAKGYEEP